MIGNARFFLSFNLKACYLAFMQVKVLTLDDKDSILNLERAQVSEEDFMFEWTASWREEFLDFYLEKGWSYAVYTGGKISSYFLAQPILFLRAHMQSLWLEHMYISNEEEKNYLLEVAYRTAKDKHLQKLMFNEDLVTNLSLQDHAYVGTKESFYAKSTTKMKET